jgi:alpha-1,2-mannosyltransferase
MQTSRVGEFEVSRNHSVLGVLTRWQLGLPWLWAALVAVIVIAALLQARRHFRRHELVSAALVIGSASLAASPISWPHHLVWTILAGVWLLARRAPLPMIFGAAIVITQSLLWSWDGTGSTTVVSELLAEAPTWTAVAICLLGLGDQHGPDHGIGDLSTPATTQAAESSV